MCSAFVCSAGMLSSLGGCTPGWRCQTRDPEHSAQVAGPSSSGGSPGGCQPLEGTLGNTRSPPWTEQGSPLGIFHLHLSPGTITPSSGPVYHSSCSWAGPLPSQTQTIYHIASREGALWPSGLDLPPVYSWAAIRSPAKHSHASASPCTLP